MPARDRPMALYVSQAESENVAHNRCTLLVAGQLLQSISETGALRLYANCQKRIKKYQGRGSGRLRCCSWGCNIEWFSLKDRASACPHPSRMGCRETNTGAKHAR